MTRLSDSVFSTLVLTALRRIFERMPLSCIAVGDALGAASDRSRGGAKAAGKSGPRCQSVRRRRQSI